MQSDNMTALLTALDEWNDTSGGRRVFTVIPTFAADNGKAVARGGVAVTAESPAAALAFGYGVWMNSLEGVTGFIAQDITEMVGAGKDKGHD